MYCAKHLYLDIVPVSLYAIYIWYSNRTTIEHYRKN